MFKDLEHKITRGGNNFSLGGKLKFVEKYKVFYISHNLIVL